MGKVTGFLEDGRHTPARRPVSERVKDWREVYTHWDEKDARTQAGRCMDCGIPFCNKGCPLGNLIPEWNDLVYNGDWKAAIERLHSTNNFPEFTGRICPAPCEPACTLSINDSPVTIEMVERAISTRAWEEGWITPEPPSNRTGKKVAIVGSGPAGLAAAQQLNRAGHSVMVFERDELLGGLLQLGIPEFKLEKHLVDRRIQQMEEEGVVFKPSTSVGKDIAVDELLASFDAVCLAIGSTKPRDLLIPGRELKGVAFAMQYLTRQNRRLKECSLSGGEELEAEGKNVLILGGGDTGADCLGTAHRQQAKNVVQIEIMPHPPHERRMLNPWPQWPLVFRISTAHEEGGLRDYSVLVKRFEGDADGNVQCAVCMRVSWGKGENGRLSMREVSGTEFSIPCELVLLAMGFVHPEHEGPLDDLEIEYDQRGNIKTDVSLQSSIPKLFACGDAQRGQSLVVHAIASGRACARSIDLYLSGGVSSLPPIHQYARPSIRNGNGT